MSEKERIEKVSHVDASIIEEATETDKKNVFFWAMYDLANTIFSMMIVSLIINKYVLVIGQNAGMGYGLVDFLFGTVQLGMQFIVAISVPILGNFSDKAGKRKPFVISLTGIILLFGTLIGFTQNSLALTIIFFLIANIAYQFSLVFYDAMLPFIAKEGDRETVAGFGIGWGYLGTVISLLVALPFILFIGGIDSTSTPPKFGYAETPIVFFISMLLFLVFAIPFFFVREKQSKGDIPPLRRLIVKSLREVKSTFMDIKENKPMLRFIIGYFFVSDIANVVVAKMLLIVTDGLVVGADSSLRDLYGSGFIIISAMSAVVSTIFVGKFGKKYGGKSTFYLVGLLWGISLIIGVVLIFAYDLIYVGLNLPFIMFILMGIIAGPALGGTWTAARIMVMELSPKDKFGEYFGFSKLSGKISSAIGPFIWGSVMLSYGLFGNNAYGLAMISVAIIMVIGILIISTIEYPDESKLEPKLK